MRRAVTFSLVVLTAFLWAASLWRLSARVTGMDLVYAGHSGRTGTAASDRFCGLRSHL